MKNYYTDKPIVPYRRSVVAMTDVIAYMATIDVLVEVKRSAYVVFRNESANGASGLNNNFIGAQADSGRWDEKWTPKIIGVVATQENRGGNRFFVAFDRWQTSVDMLADRLHDRGVYIGGTTFKFSSMKVTTVEDLATAYYKEWVTGNADAVPSPILIHDFTSMYNQAVTHFA